MIVDPLSSDVETSLIDKDGVASSSVIVKVPVESLIVAFEALDKSSLLFHLLHLMSQLIQLLVVVVLPALIVNVMLYNHFLLLLFHLM